MANYTYKCGYCEEEETMATSVTNFLKLVSENFFEEKKCKQCNKTVKFIRVFEPASSKITKDKETLMLEIQADARSIVEKVNAGDINMIRQVYGEEL